MKIDPISNGNLRIWLAEEEIKEWGLTEENRYGIRRLVRKALSTMGKEAAPHVTAEMIPVEGGCVVLVSPVEHPRRLPAVYAVEGEDVLQAIRTRWSRISKDMAQVYAMGEEYRIVVYGDNTEYLLREYAQPVGRGEGVAAHVAEYGQWVTELVPVRPEREGFLP